jgi:hypothetical protein
VGSNIRLSTLLAQKSVSFPFHWSERPSFKPTLDFINVELNSAFNTVVKRESEGYDIIFIASVLSQIKIRICDLLHFI